MYVIIIKDIYRFSKLNFKIKLIRFIVAALRISKIQLQGLSETQNLMNSDEFNR